MSPNVLTELKEEKKIGMLFLNVIWIVLSQINVISHGLGISPDAERLY